MATLLYKFATKLKRGTHTRKDETVLFKKRKHVNEHGLGKPVSKFLLILFQPVTAMLSHA